MAPLYSPEQVSVSSPRAHPHEIIDLDFYSPGFFSLLNVQNAVASENDLHQRFVPEPLSHHGLSGEKQKTWAPGKGTG